MKLLLDENLSPRLVPRLLSLFARLVHVRDVGLRQAGDGAIWDWAKTQGYSVITTDFYFIAMSQRLGPPPKVIHIEECDLPLRGIEDMLRPSALLITEFDKHERAGILTLRVPQGCESP